MTSTKRVVCKKGDVFTVKTNERYRYFQLVDYDITQLNSDVIAVFEGSYPEPISQEEVVSKPVEFFAHTVVRMGISKYWEKAGSAPPVDSSQAIFKDVSGDRDDSDHMDGISRHWQVWGIGEGWKYVGNEKKTPKNAVLGIVWDPESIYRKITQGRYGFEYYGSIY